MADPRMQFSFQVELPGPSAQTARQAIDLVCDADWARVVTGDEDAEQPPDIDEIRFEQAFPESQCASAEVRNLALEMLMGVVETAPDPEALARGSALDGLYVQADGAGLHFYNEPDVFCLDAVIAIVQILQDRLGAPGVPIEYAETSTVPRPGGFGGGAFWLEPGEAPACMNTGDWLHEMKEASAARNPGAEGDGPSSAM